MNPREPLEFYLVFELLARYHQEGGQLVKVGGMGALV